MIEVPVDAPPEIRDKIIERLSTKGIIKSVERRLHFALAIAIDEIETKSQQKRSKLEVCLKNKPTHAEREALRRIYNYLEEKNLNYTLQALKEEIESRKPVKRVALASADDDGTFILK